MRLVLISDTHQRHERVTVPDGDVLVHAGDFTMLGEHREIASFNNWFAKFPHKDKIIIAGNHELHLNEDKIKSLTSGQYLQDSGVEIEGIKFWGSPYTPEFYDWAFMLPRGEPLRKKWATIPEDTDVLITHGPPMGILDMPYPDGRHVGDADLYQRVQALKLKLHVFGHIHGGHGLQVVNDTTYINASVVDEAYKPVNPAQVFDI